ncbi:hypothetical protein QBC43DRAFT_334874 [Cladorrhinum sp. PSN259]|nr:hypothetical protein QBC43DRAFT_334874 [Cladorrhinum sp. PSN259]
MLPLTLRLTLQVLLSTILTLTLTHLTTAHPQPLSHTPQAQDTWSVSFYVDDRCETFIISSTASSTPSDGQTGCQPTLPWPGLDSLVRIHSYRFVSTTDVKTNYTWGLRVYDDGGCVFLMGIDDGSNKGGCKSVEGGFGSWNVFEFEE